MSGTKTGKRRGRGDHGITWDKANKCYVGTISLGHDSSGKRIRPTVRGKTVAEVKDKLSDLEDEIKAGIRTPANFKVEQCVREWLDELKLDPDTVATYRGQAEKWIYPKLGAKLLRDLTVADVERFFNEVGGVLGKASLLKLKGTLRRSIKRAQKHELIGKNVVELVDLPEGQPGRPSRAMTQDEARKVLEAAGGSTSSFTRVVRISLNNQGATHAARETGELACGTKSRRGGPVKQVTADLSETTCRPCRANLGLDASENAHLRLEALFVLSITLGLRPGELRALTWDHVDLTNGVIHIWQSTKRDGDVKTKKSRRSLQLPKRALDALKAHKKRQAGERLAAGELWQDHNLVFCHEDGRPYTKDALNWRFGKITQRAGLGHWHPHEGRHTAVSIMSANGVPTQEITDTVGHKSTHITETVYRKVIVPTIRGGATVMDSVFGSDTEDASHLASH